MNGSRRTGVEVVVVALIPLLSLLLFISVEGKSPADQQEEKCSSGSGSSSPC